MLPEDLIWGATDGPGMVFDAFVGTGGSCTGGAPNAQLTYVRMVRRTPPPAPSCVRPRFLPPLPSGGVAMR